MEHESLILFIDEIYALYLKIFTTFSAYEQDKRSS